CAAHASSSTHLYALSLHDALPISISPRSDLRHPAGAKGEPPPRTYGQGRRRPPPPTKGRFPLMPASLNTEDFSDLIDANARYAEDRKSTRLNSSHVSISYAVFCLK